MNSRRIAITGATSGLGKATALELVRQNHVVIALVRDAAKGSELAEEAAGLSTNGGVEVVDCDLASLSSVSAAASKFTSGSVGRPDVIVCNAGLQVVDGVKQSVDGVELTMAVNVLAHHRLCSEMIGILEPGARIIFLGSETHRGGLSAWGFPAPKWTKPDDLFFPGPDVSKSSQAGRVRYANSKLATIYLATEVNRRFADNGITANTFDPGLMPETGLDREYPAMVQKLYRAVIPLIVRMPEARRVVDSARALAWLAVSDDAAGWTDKYVSGTKPRPPSELSQVSENAKQLWEFCTALDV